jgi:hypothetical protein
MSVEASRAVWLYNDGLCLSHNDAEIESLKVTGGELAVWAALADHANKGGYGFPGVETIARECGVTARSVQGHLRALEEKGILKTDIGGGKLANGYHLPVMSKAEAGAKRKQIKARHAAEKAPPSQGGRQKSPSPVKGRSRPVKESSPVEVKALSPEGRTGFHPNRNITTIVQPSCLTQTAAALPPPLPFGWEGEPTETDRQLQDFQRLREAAGRQAAQAAGVESPPSPLASGPGAFPICGWENSTPALLAELDVERARSTQTRRR